MSRRKIEAAPEAEVTTEQPLHTKYRPTVVTEVLGQADVVKSLKKLVGAKNPGHAYLFTGPAGTGKTTFARALARQFNCDPNSILEVDAATNSGVDAMRDVMSALRYQGFGDTPNKAIIIDECHALSKQAWSSLLKPVEEPPPHVYIFFCTTEQGKVPEAIVTRCHSYNLKPLRYDDVMDLLEEVADREGMSTPDAVLQLVARACNGSARQALVMLSMVRDVTDVDEAGRLLESPLENKEIIDLCRLLVGRKLDWKKLVEVLKAMPEMPAESMRIVIVNYLAKCAMGARSEKEAEEMVYMLEQFSAPFNTSDKLAPILVSFGRILFA